MGIFSWFSGSSNTKSMSKYGSLLANVIDEKIKTYKNEEEEIKKDLKSYNMEYKKQKYYETVFRLYLRITEYHITYNITKKVENLRGDDKDLIEALSESFFENLSDEYASYYDIEESIRVKTELTSSKQPLITVSRMAAEEYTGSRISNKGGTGAEEVVYFGSLAKSFMRILEEMDNEAGL